MKNHIMIDIETLGNTSFSSIVSIGAVQFDIETGEYGKEFYIEINPNSCIDFGLHEDDSTITWWNKTNSEELEKIRSRGEGLDTSLVKFLNWFKSLGDSNDLFVWGNSNRFDLGLLDNALSSVGIDTFWNFRNERDVRTLVSFAPEIRNNEKQIGMSHNALDDCKFQINYCSKIYNKIKINE